MGVQGLGRVLQDRPARATERDDPQRLQYALPAVTRTWARSSRRSTVASTTTLPTAGTTCRSQADTPAPAGRFTPALVRSGSRTTPAARTRRSTTGTAAWWIKSFVNLWHGEATSLLSVGPLGQPLFLNFDDRSWDIDVQKTQVVRSRHLLTYGGNYRHNWCSITMAPGADKRDMAGAYIQDEILLSEHFRWVVGGRVDKYNVPENPVFSPRTAFLVKPTPGADLPRVVQQGLPRPVVVPELPGDRSREPAEPRRAQPCSWQGTSSSSRSRAWGTWT